MESHIDEDALLAQTRDVIEHGVDIVVLTTGIGFRGWLETAESFGIGSRLLEALASTRLIARGPKAEGALKAAGHRTAVVANGDQEFGVVGDAVHREAALAMVDSKGRVPYGSVAPNLVMKDPTAPFGVRMDPKATSEAVRASFSRADVVLLEMSDLARVEAYTSLASDDAINAERAVAMPRRMPSQSCGRARQPSGP